MENPIKMDDLGVPLFLETPIYLYSNDLLPRTAPTPNPFSRFCEILALMVFVFFQVRWRKRQDVPENLRNGHWQVPDALESSIVGPKFHMEWPVSLAPNPKVACEGHQIVPNFDRAKFKHNMFVDEMTKSNEPVMMVKFIVSGKVSIIWLLQPDEGWRFSTLQAYICK